VACALCGLCPARLSLRIQPYRIEHYGDWRGERARCGVTQPAAGYQAKPGYARRDAGVVCVRRGGRRGEHSRRVSVLRARRSALESRVGSPGARAMPSGSAVSMCTNHHGRRRGRQGVASPSRRGNSLATRIRRGTLSGLTSQSGLDYSSPICRPRPARAHAIAIILHRVRVTAERPDMLRHRGTRRALYTFSVNLPFSSDLCERLWWRSMM
jgi:hypothetical protein